MSLLLSNITVNGLLDGTGILTRSPVVVATTTAGTLSSSFANGSVIDGITLSTGNRILIKDQVVATENGIYTVASTGTPSRADDMQVGATAGGYMITVHKGTVNSTSIYICTSIKPNDVVGTNNLTFSRADISTGVVPVTKGGTGLSTLTSGNFLIGAGASNVDLTKVAPSGVVVGTTDSQTLTNKTLTSPLVGTSSNNVTLSVGSQIGAGTLNLPPILTTTDTIVALGLAQRLQNKTIDTSNTIFEHSGTATKRITLDLSSLTAARAYIAPDRAGTIATEEYVQAYAQGLLIKDAVRVATTVAGTLSSSFANGSVIDGVTLVTGDRILIKNQATGSENGIYVVNASGAPTRSVDFDGITIIPGLSEVRDGCFTYVGEGTINASTGWVLITNNVITVGVTSLVFTQFSGAGAVTAGTGISITGTAISADRLANGGIILSGNSMQVDLGASSITGVVATSKGGTGLSGATPFTNNTFITASSASTLASSKVVPVGVVVGTTDLQTLTNKTLTSPTINQILDSNGNAILIFNTTASSVNQLSITDAAAGTSPVLSASGTDTDININLTAKGAGVYNLNASAGTTSEVRLYKAGGANYIGIKAPAVISANKTFILPNSDGTSGQVLVTDGSANLSFATRLNKIAYTFNDSVTTVSSTATLIATSNWIWQQSKYGSGGTSPYTSGTFTYMYSSDAGGVGKTLTVSIYNTTTGAILSSDSFTIPAITSGVARSFAFTLPTADAQLQLQVSRTAGTGTLINIIGGHLEFIAT